MLGTPVTTTDQRSASADRSSAAATPPVYTIGSDAAERDRLRSQTDELQEHTVALLERVDIQQGWRVLELACGPRGVLELLAQHVGPTGAVTGLDINPVHVAQARQHVTSLDSARDGTRLSAWYVPSRNGAAAVLLHGSHGTRVDTLPQLRMLSSAGYGILAYDARGHGHSAGQPNALGWAGANDLAGAVTFLDHQPGLSPRRIAALGLSMGAEEALRAAGSGVGLHAVVADGAGASTLGDDQLVPHGLAPVFLSETWLTMRTIELVSGETEPAPLKGIVARIHIPVLLIASNAANEHTIDSACRALIGPRATLWYVPDATHTNAFGQHPQAYTTRVLTFLGSAILSR